MDVTIPLRDGGPTTLHVELFSEEWGFSFRHDDKVSWIRVTDIAFVHGRDDHGLLSEKPALKNIGLLVQSLQERFGIQFDPDAARIRTNLNDAESTIRDWISGW